MALQLPASLSARITIVFMVLVVTFAGFSLWTVRGIQNLSSAIRIVHAGYLQLSLVSGDLEGKQTTLRSYLREELGEEHSERWARKRLQRLIDARQSLLAKTERILSDVRAMDGVRDNQFQGTTDLVTSLRKLVDESSPQYEILLANPPIAGRITDPVSAEYAEVVKAQKKQLRLELKIRQLTETLKAHEASMVLRSGDRLDAFARKIFVYTLGFTGLALVLGILLVFGAVVMLRPLQRLRDAAQRIGRGDYEHRISVTGPKEIADLAKEFNAMGLAIQERSRELLRTERLATAGMMAAKMNHEVRNPLSSISLNTSLLGDELKELPSEQTEEARSLCQSINKEVDRLVELAEGYLEFGLMPKPKLVPESLEEIVRSVVEFMQEKLRSQGVSVEVELSGNAKPLLLDEAQMRQVLINLIRNAADAVTGEDGKAGRVTLAVRHSGGEAVLVVSDNGPGIPEKVIGNLFEELVSTKSSGTGLGLALTQQIVRDHGGTISASNPPGGGAEFCIRFPAEQAS